VGIKDTVSLRILCGAALVYKRNVMRDVGCGVLVGAVGVPPTYHQKIIIKINE